MPNRVYSLLDVLQQLNQDSTQYIAANPNEIVSQFIGGGETLVGSPSWSMSPWTPYPWLVANNDGPTGLWLLADPAGASFAFDSNPYSSKNPTNSMFGTVTFGQTGGLIPGLSYGKFDGAASGLSANLATIAAGASYTMECWVNQTATTGSQIAMGFNQGTGGTSDIYAGVSGVPRFRASTAAGGTTDVISSGGAISTGSWHHLVATYDGSNMRFYVDGTLRGGPTAIATGVANSGTMYIGCLGASGFMNGAIFGVALYPVALSSTQVANHYAWGRAISIASNFYDDSFEGAPPSFSVQHTVGASLGIDSTGTLNAWTQDSGSWSIASNVVTSPSGNSTMHWGHPDWGDGIWKLRVTWATNSIPSLSVHYHNGGSDAIYSRLLSASVEFRKRVGGITSVMGSIALAQTNATAYWMEIVAIGTFYTLNVYTDSAGAIGTLRGTVGPVFVGDPLLQTGPMGVMNEVGASAAFTCGGAFNTVCHAIAPCPTIAGNGISAGWTRAVVAGEPTFCWSKINPYNGQYSLSIYNAHSSGDGYWTATPPSMALIAPYVLACQARATGAGVAEIGLSGVYGTLATNDGNWYPIITSTTQTFTVGPALRMSGAGLAYFDMITISEQSSTSGFTYGTAPSRYGLFTYPNPPRRGSSQLWGTAIWGSFQWG